MGIASQDKMEIRSCLPKLLLAQHKSVPYFIRNKLCKVIVDIGRQDWPMFYHDFFSNTLQVSPADMLSLVKLFNSDVLIDVFLNTEMTAEPYLRTYMQVSPHSPC